MSSTRRSTRIGNSPHASGFFRQNRHRLRDLRDLAVHVDAKQRLGELVPIGLFLAVTAAARHLGDQLILIDPM